MNQRNIWYRWLFYGLAAALFLILQAAALRHVRVWGIHPFLPPVLVAVAASWEDRQEGLCAAAVFGLLCDLTMTPPIPCFYVLSFTAIAFLSGLVAKRWILPKWVRTYFSDMTMNAARISFRYAFGKDAAQVSGT